MDIGFIDNLATGFSAAASFSNLGFALIGCLLGTLIGVLPGIGPIATLAMLLPNPPPKRRTTMQKRRIRTGWVLATCGVLVAGHRYQTFLLKTFDIIVDH